MKLINPLLIIRILSTILLIETFAFLFCIPVALLYGEPLRPFIIPAIISGFLYINLRISSLNADTSRYSIRDGYLVVTISWIVIVLMGSLPYLLSHTIPSFINALFESTSGFTTTGASILADVESLPFSILFWRSLTHWIGGIGIIVLVLIILPSLKISGYQLFSLESSLKEKIHPQTKVIGLRVTLIYIGLTIAETILLYLGDMTFFDSVCHSFGTIATGGFSTKNTSLQFFSNYSQYIVMIFMFLAGTSMVVYYYLAKMQFRKIKHNEEVWFYIAVVTVSGIFATLILFIHSSVSFTDAFRSGFFQVISIITCTGFATDDYLLWPLAGLLLIFLLMFSGGSTGSTSGGIKMARHLIVLKSIKNVFRRLLHPKALLAVRLNGRIVNSRTNNTIISFVILYLFLFLCGTVILTAAGSDPVTSASSVATCMAGIGPGLGTVGPMNNYVHLNDFSKIFLSFLMITGRLEILTVFALFTKTFWKI